MFIGKSFAFEGDGLIGLEGVFHFEEAVVIFDNVPQVEKNDEQLKLLAQMNLLVNDKRFIFL